MILNDDILLLSMSENHMNRLLACCNNYANNWKLEFNASKSVSYSSYSNPIGKFYLGKQIIPCSEGFTYLLVTKNLLKTFFQRNLETVKNQCIHLGLLVVNQRHSILKR